MNQLAEEQVPTMDVALKTSIPLPGAEERTRCSAVPRE